jgi:hypothetical protein
MNVEGKRWKVEADAATSLKANTDDAVLVLRLGMAISAMRAAQRLTVCVGEGDAPGVVRDRLWSFLLAAGYLHELRVTLQPRFPKVREFAVKGGATEDLAKAVGEILSGKSDFSGVLDRVRNQLVFHFDEAAAAEWVDQFDRERVLWVEGIGKKTGDTLYRASLDAVSSAILPRVEGTAEEGRRKFAALIAEVLRVTDLVTTLFEHAIAGYLNSVGAELEEREE